MILYQWVQNNWFSAGSLQRAFFHITKACNEGTAWLRSGINTKYIMVRIDMRTGDFIFLDSNMTVMLESDLKKLFEGLEIKKENFKELDIVKKLKGSNNKGDSDGSPTT